MLLGAVLVAVVRRPVEPPRRETVRGHRVFGVGRHAVRGIDVTLGDRRFSAHRTADGWRVDGESASRGTAEALDDLLGTLVALRAVDVFRSRDASSYGLNSPRATIELITPRERRRLVIGTLNPAGSSFYGQRVGDPRVLQIGTLLLSDLERVFYHRDGPRASG